MGDESLEGRVCALEKAEITLSEDIKKLDTRVTKHGTEIDEQRKLNADLDKRFTVMEHVQQTTLDNTKEIKQDVRELMKTRDDDHAHKPLAESRADKRQVRMAVITAVILAFVNFIMLVIFPFLSSKP